MCADRYISASSKDTEQTQRQILAHNEFMQAQGCSAKKPGTVAGPFDRLEGVFKR